MRGTQLFLAIGLISLDLFTAPSSTSAAELSLQSPRQRVSVHIRHKTKLVAYRATRAVRDFDGTPVVFRPYRTVDVMTLDGTYLRKIEYEAVSTPRASPRYYHNGEPVLPNYPRGWPRVATLRYQLMSGHY